LSSPEISIVVVTLGRDTLYPLLEILRTQDTTRPFEVILVAQVPLDESRVDRSIETIIYPTAGHGIAARRNIGFRSAAGEVVVFIDDDERPLGDSWLEGLVDPILTGGETVSTSGVAVPTGEGFIADLISSLGFPGGGSVGFRRMWNVDDRGFTGHICTGNFAVRKDALEELGGFDEGLQHGAEDTHLAEKMSSAGIEAVYVEESTVFHEPRRSLTGFFRWQIRRGRSAYQLKMARELDRRLVGNRFTSTWRILRSNLVSVRAPAMLAIVLFEYLFQAIGYGMEMVLCRPRPGAR